MQKELIWGKLIKVKKNRMERQKSLNEGDPVLGRPGAVCEFVQVPRPDLTGELILQASGR